MSPAPATRGTSEKFSDNWVRRKLTRGHAHPVTPPPRAASARPPQARSSGRRDFSGCRRRGGGGERKTCASPSPPPRSGPRPCHAVRARLGCPCPRARSRCQGANGRGRRSSATCAGRPLPKARPARLRAPRRSPGGQALSKFPDATRGQAGTPSAPRPRAQSCSAGCRRPSLPGSASPAAAAAAGDCLHGPARRSALVSGKLRGWLR